MEIGLAAASAKLAALGEIERDEAEAEALALLSPQARLEEEERRKRASERTAAAAKEEERRKARNRKHRERKKKKKERIAEAQAALDCAASAMDPVEINRARVHLEQLKTPGPPETPWARRSNEDAAHRAEPSHRAEASLQALQTALAASQAALANWGVSSEEGSDDDEEWEEYMEEYKRREAEKEARKLREREKRYERERAEAEMMASLRGEPVPSARRVFDALSPNTQAQVRQAAENKFEAATRRRDAAEVELAESTIAFAIGLARLYVAAKDKEAEQAPRAVKDKDAEGAPRAAELPWCLATSRHTRRTHIPARESASSPDHASA